MSRVGCVCRFGELSNVGKVKTGRTRQQSKKCRHDTKKNPVVAPPKRHQYTGLIRLFIAVICIIVYHNCLYCGFVFDDISAIKDNRDLRPHAPIIDVFLNDFWGTPIHKEQSHKSYRPLTVLTFRWNYAIHGLNPFGYHFVNMVLHVIVSILYHKVTAMFLPELASFVAATLFAIHPIHTEAPDRLSLGMEPGPLAEKLYYEIY